MITHQTQPTYHFTRGDKPIDQPTGTDLYTCLACGGMAQSYGLAVGTRIECPECGAAKANGQRNGKCKGFERIESKQETEYENNGGNNLSTLRKEGNEKGTGDSEDQVVYQVRGHCEQGKGKTEEEKGVERIDKGHGEQSEERRHLADQAVKSGEATGTGALRPVLNGRCLV